MNVSECCGNRGDAFREGRRDEGKGEREGGREGGIQRIL
jgi:hypothetical protein